MLIKEDVRMPVVEVAAGQVWITTVTVQIMRGVGQGKTKKPCFVLELFTALYSPSPQLYALSSCQDGVFSHEFAV